MIRLEIIGVEELRRKFAQFPNQFHAAMSETLRASLLTLTESVPPYPPQWANSQYIRTGMLGRSLGSGQQGGGSGQADIHQVQMGPKMSQATWGTRLEYAPHVIGEGTQAPMFKKRGWYTVLTIANKAQAKIGRLFNIMAERLAKWLDAQ